MLRDPGKIKRDSGNSYELPLSLFDIEKGEGNWYVLQAILLDEFIIPAEKGKVNRLVINFTICLQAEDFPAILFIIYSKNTVVLHIDGPEKICYI